MLNFLHIIQLFHPSFLTVLFRFLDMIPIMSFSLCILATSPKRVADTVILA